VPRLFDLVKLDPKQQKGLALAFYYAMRDTVVANDLDQASRIAYGADKRWRRVVTLKARARAHTHTHRPRARRFSLAFVPGAPLAPSCGVVGVQCRCAFPARGHPRLVFAAMQCSAAESVTRARRALRPAACSGGGHAVRGVCGRPAVEADKGPCSDCALGRAR
jgi:hypothetical protein